MRMTPEQIADAVKDLSGKKQFMEMNRLLREQDESHLWPVRGRFNVTNRAIRKARQFISECGTLEPLEYCLLVDSLVSEMVNDSRNW